MYEYGSNFNSIAKLTNKSNVDIRQHCQIPGSASALSWIRKSLGHTTIGWGTTGIQTFGADGLGSLEGRRGRGSKMCKMKLSIGMNWPCTENSRTDWCFF